MNTNPVVLDENKLAVEAVKVMAERKISQIIVSKEGTYNGIVHIHDLNREGIII